MRPSLSTLVLVVVVLVASAASSGADDDWFEARSDHFTIVSDGSEGRAKDTLEDLEQLRRLITDVFPSQRVEGTKPAVFYLFKNEKSMRPFQPTRDGEQEEWAGMYRATSFGDIVLVLADGKADGVRRLAFSQYTHLLESYNDADYPVWLSNGLASFHANTEISKKRAFIGKMRDEYRRVLGEFRSIPIRDLFAVDYESDYYRDLSLRPLFDAQSWALVHYILVGQVQNGGPLRLGKYVDLLGQGRNPLLAFQEAMGQPLEEIDRDVALYIRKSITQFFQVELAPLEMKHEFRVRKLDGAETSAHLGRLYLAARYYDEAEPVLTSSIEGRPEQVAAYEAMAELRERQKKPSEAEAFYARAVRNGSTNPHVLLRRAELFVSEKDKTSRSPEETKAVLDSLRHVIRDAPELTDAARLFGYLSLDDGETRVEAHRVIAEALERDPGNPSLIFMLAQLHSRDGSYGAARLLFGRLLERELDPAFNASVRRQYDYADTQLKYEAQRAAAAAQARAQEDGAQLPGAETEASTRESSQSTPSGDSGNRTRVDEVTTAAGILEVRGELVRFDCEGGHRFVVEAGGIHYVLDIVDVRTVEILERGKHAGSREFICGSLSEPVVVRFIPAPARDDASERRGRLVAIDFVGS